MSEDRSSDLRATSTTATASPAMAMATPGVKTTDDEQQYTTETMFIQMDGSTDNIERVVQVPQLECKVKPSAPAMRSVSFHDITYEVAQWKFCKRKPNKQILKSASGLMLPGVNAIMGPTGSGKTSLLDILADRKDKTGLSGVVLINGKRKPPNFKCLAGYVVQDDVVMGTLTVRENLHFSAALRLPLHTTRQQRKERVQRVIDELHLQKCAKTKIGNEFLRGVSGGERKRTNIGMELITEPQVLFLDEPTTGLDAHTAVSVVQLLKDLSRVNDRVVILSIHQPRYSIFKLFDSLTLLSLGSVVYHGSPHLALDYFDRLGFPCEEHENPADFFLDTINLCERALDGADGADGANGGKGEEGELTRSHCVDLPTIYQQSVEHKQLKSVIDPMLQNLQEEHKLAGKFLNGKTARIKYATNFFWQLLVVMLRSVVNLLRNPDTSILQLVSMAFFGLIIGGIYFQLGTEPLGFNDRIGVFFFIAVNQAFGSLPAIDAFIRDRSLFIHENASGYYRVSAFFLSKVLIDVFAFKILPNLTFTVIVYFMVGLQVDAAKFFIFYLTITLISTAALSIAFLISASVKVAAVANLLIAIAFVVSMLFGGLLIALESLPDWIAWMKYLSFIRYAIEAMAINEMDGLVFSGPCNIDVSFFGNSTSECSLDLSNATCSFDGLDQLSTLGYEVDWLWYDQLAMIVFAILFFFLAYTVLRTVKKDK